MAVVSSGYGWREHPIEGGEKFHAGADLAAPYGEAVGAFADGVVDYIGESPAYGQYLQIRHAGGVTSFYAHCSKLCVQQGQQGSWGRRWLRWATRGRPPDLTSTLSCGSTGNC
jgi:murein DD-endopeptidase MepM/ murein hydrolase activator NlpD